MTQDPYEAQGKNCKVLKDTGGHYFVGGVRVCCVDDNVRVNHPTQPKTQVERWREERLDNLLFVVNHHHKSLLVEDSAETLKECTLQGTDNCYHRFTVKIPELEALISQATQPIHPKYQVGTFADDVGKENCQAKEG